jgi:hypothetical protein
MEIDKITPEADPTGVRYCNTTQWQSQNKNLPMTKLLLLIIDKESFDKLRLSAFVISYWAGVLRWT